MAPGSFVVRLERCWGNECGERGAAGLGSHLVVLSGA